MKKSIIICILALFPVLNGFGHNMFQENTDDSPDALKIACTQNLSGLINSIQQEYILSNPGIDFKVDLLEEGVGGVELLSADFILTSASAYGYTKDGNWSLTIGRDVLVPVISKENPFFKELVAQGIKPSAYADLLSDGDSFKWGDILSSDNSSGLTLYLDKSKTSMDRLVNFSGIDRENTNMGHITRTSDVVNSVISNEYSIGFCSLIDLVGTDIQSFIGDLEIVPIDLNENGKVDHYENYQQDYADFTRAVWIGKYPRTLYNEIRLVSESVPGDEAAINFVEWLLTSGQEQLAVSGFTGLVPGEVRSTMNNFYAYETELRVENATYSNVGRALVWILGILGFGLLSGIVVLLASRKTAPVLEEERIAGILDKKNVIIPGGVLFDKSHTWSYMEKNGMVRVGAADFLQHITGKVSKIIPKNPGESVKRGEPMFTIVQDGKHLVLYSPVSGTIEQVNSELTRDSSAINSSPYNNGWIYELKPSKWMSEYRNFLMGDVYKEWLSKEVGRLKEFLNSTIFRNQTSGLQPVLQDGGEIVDNLLEGMGPDMWEEFQLGFIDKAF